LLQIIFSLLTNNSITLKKIINITSSKIKSLVSHFFSFSEFFIFYSHKKVVNFSHFFERNKNRLVRFFLMKRGRYNRPFLHLTTMGVLGVGVLIAPYLADTYPIFASDASEVMDLNEASAKEQSIIVGENVFQTVRSDKPRDTVLIYTVEKGDTLSTIAKKFDISTETVRWENNISGDNVNIGDKLRILPVTGIAHKVSSGETVYSIAKRYDTEAQKIVDFPFNDFANPETFSLVNGQMLIVPDGIEPSVQSTTPKRQFYIAQGPATRVTSGGFTWPLRGGISQFASWYHMGIDITNPVGTPIVAAQSGTVTYVSVGSWDSGYGNNVWISNGSGTDSHYAHMSGVNVGIGQQVVAGQTVVGWVGMSGRTTGPHLHFEVRNSGTLVNPLNFLQ
jgi:murein DD-endopeptidase MepM/ murein hydrolase activator NlpD